MFNLSAFKCFSITCDACVYKIIKKEIMKKKKNEVENFKKKQARKKTKTVIKRKHDQSYLRTELEPLRDVNILITFVPWINCCSCPTSYY